VYGYPAYAYPACPYATYPVFYVYPTYPVYEGVTIQFAYYPGYDWGGYYGEWGQG
jgi:hypothetical protein